MIIIKGNRKQETGNKQNGQTLIETIVAIVVLTTALASGLALAIYVLGNAGLNKSQIIATNLAREGVEVLRYMRDTNWLEGDSKGGGWGLQYCADIDANCYPGWLTGPSGSPYNNYDLLQSAGNNNRWRLEYDFNNNVWRKLQTNSNYNLYLQSNGMYTHDSNGTSFFARRIVIDHCYAPTAGCTQYTQQNPSVIVQSIVAWRDKKCNWSGTDPTSAPSSCKVTIEEHLTNWKDYK